MAVDIDLPPAVIFSELTGRPRVTLMDMRSALEEFGQIEQPGRLFVLRALCYGIACSKARDPGLPKVIQAGYQDFATRLEALEPTLGNEVH